MREAEDPRQDGSISESAAKILAWKEQVVLPLGFHEWQKGWSIAAYCDISDGHSARTPQSI